MNTNFDTTDDESTTTTDDDTIQIQTITPFQAYVLLFAITYTATLALGAFIDAIRNR